MSYIPQNSTDSQSQKNLGRRRKERKNEKKNMVTYCAHFWQAMVGKWGYPLSTTQFIKTLTQVLFGIYLYQCMETSHPKHVLKEDVVLCAAHMGLQLRGQGRQQFIQTYRQEKKENLSPELQSELEPHKARPQNCVSISWRHVDMSSLCCPFEFFNFNKKKKL